MRRKAPPMESLEEYQHRPYHAVDAVRATARKRAPIAQPQLSPRVLERPVGTLWFEVWLKSSRIIGGPDNSCGPYSTAEIVELNWLPLRGDIEAPRLGVTENATFLGSAEVGTGSHFRKSFSTTRKAAGSSDVY